MSDVKAKAEARRAKILARESSKKVQAIGDDISLPVDGTPQERPLAKRRNLVKTLSENVMDGAQNEREEGATPSKLDLSADDATVDGTAANTESATKSDYSKAEKSAEGAPEPSKVESKAKTIDVNLDDPDVESIDQHVEKHNEEASPNKSTPATTESLSRKPSARLSPKKSMKEIEEEVARNTALYDAETLRGDKKPRKSAKEMQEAAQTKKTTAVVSNIQPTNVTRLVRMFVIIALGSYKGYTVVQNNIATRDNSMILAMEGANVNLPVSFDEFGDPIALSGAERLSYQSEQRQSSQSKTRTWGEWVQYKVTAPFESTLTAVGISYWLANMLSSGINSRLKNPPKSKGILEQALALYQSGFEGVLERVFCLIGEYALHLGTILLVATVLTIYTEIPTVNTSMDASAVVDAVSSTVASVVNSAAAGGDSVQGEL